MRRRVPAPSPAPSPASSPGSSPASGPASGPCRARVRIPASSARSVGLVAAAAVVAVPLLAAPGASAAAPSVSWSDRSVVAGKAMTATVGAASVDGATVALQRRFPEGWRVADAARG